MGKNTCELPDPTTSDGTCLILRDFHILVFVRGTLFRPRPAAVGIRLLRHCLRLEGTMLAWLRGLNLEGEPAGTARG